MLTASFWDETAFEVRVEALDSTQYPSVDALHAAQMDVIDGWLREHPEQLVTRFPAAELSRLVARHQAVKARLGRAADAERTTRAALLSRKETVTMLQQEGARGEAVQEARRGVRAAKQEHQASRVSQRDLRAEEHRIRAEIRRVPDADRRSTVAPAGG
jgi:hypothetical protein